MSRLDYLSENTLVDRIKYLSQQLEEIKTLQTVNSEIIIPVTAQWTGNWTDSSSYVNLVPSRGVINFDAYANYSLYFECLMFTDAGTGYLRLYNDTDSTAFASSELSTTAVGESNAVLLRSGELTKPTGIKTIRIQGKQTGGAGKDVNCMIGRMVFKIGT